MKGLVTLAVLCGTLHGQRLSEADAAALIEKTRAVALRYSVGLPDFICTQTVRRFADPRGDNRWQRLDVLTVKLTFFGHHEEYKLMEINGKSTVLDYGNTGGPMSKGEFGSALIQLFHPKTAALFHWKGWGKIHGERVAVYGFKVDREHTQFHVTYGPVSAGPNHVLAPYYGEVEVEPETGQVRKVEQHAELPVGFPIRESSMTVEYGYADVGGQRYLLPARAESTMAARSYRTRNETEFTEYRKFQTETTITFGK